MSRKMEAATRRPDRGGRSTVFGTKGAVACEHPSAAVIGLRVLDSGGTAADACVAMAAAMAVLSPMQTGMGGDAFLLFYEADDAEALSRIGELVPALSDKGALWIVSRKGKAATVKDVEVMAAAKSFGLVDNKVVGFSETLTALRFTRRRA